MVKKLLFLNVLAVPVSLAFVMLAPQPAHASSPAESMKCTDAPRASWVGEAKIRKHFGEDQYVRVVFKISKTNCYEFYAISKDGATVEAYYDPVSMALVRFSRVEGSGKFQAPAVPALTGENPEIKTPAVPLRAANR